MRRAARPHQTDDSTKKLQENTVLDDIVPVRRSREDARKTYNRLSKWYDLLAESSEKRLRQKGIQMLSPREGERILEIGYGTGRAITLLAQSVGSCGAVYGIDLSPNMQSVATRRAARAALLPRIHLSVGDATEKLPYPDNFFHGIFMNFTLELFNTSELREVLRECRRILQPEGRLVTVSMDSRQSGKHNFMSELYLWGHKHFPRLVDCRPIPVRAVLRHFEWGIIAEQQESTFGLPVAILQAKINAENDESSFVR